VLLNHTQPLVMSQLLILLQTAAAPLLQLGALPELRGLLLTLLLLLKHPPPLAQQRLLHLQ
jgi:hypothetical protein